MEESRVVLVNMCLYMALFVFCWYRFKFKNLTTFLALLYMFSAISSYLLYNFPLYRMSFTAVGSITLEASIYLFLLNMILITTFTNAKLENLRILTLYNGSLILKWQKFLVISLSIYALACFPSSVTAFFGGSDLADLRNEQYGDNTAASPFFAVNIISRIFGALTLALLCIPFINYFILKKTSRWDKYALYVYAITKINTILAAVSRATIVFSLLEVFVVLLLFLPFIGKKMKKIIFRWLVIMLTGTYLIFSVITYARFESSGDEVLPVYSTLRYSGEAQLNFMALVYPDLEKPWCGFRQLALFRRIIGLPYDDGTTRNGETIYDDYIELTYHWPHPVYVFYSLAGFWVINMGFVLPYIVAILVHCMFKRKYMKSRGRISYMLIFLTVVFASYYGKGIFYSDYQSEPGNMLILFLIYAFWALKRNGHAITISNNPYK